MLNLKYQFFIVMVLMLYFTRINAQTERNQNITLTISELEIKDEYLNFKLELLNNGSS